MPVPADKDNSAKVFIGGLTAETDEESLKKFYGQWGGEIIDCVVMRDPGTKRSRGFGFITYTDSAQVDTAMEHRPHVIDGKEVDAKRAIPREFANKKEAHMSVKRIYVTGIKDEHTEDMLREHFNQYGAVTEVDIVVDKQTQQKRGFAFISFDDYDAADKAVLARHHMINEKRCDVRKALSKEEMARMQQYEKDKLSRYQRTRNSADYGRGGYGGSYGYDNGYYGTQGGGGGGWNMRAWSANQQMGPAAYNYGNSTSGGWGQQNGSYGDAWNSGSGWGQSSYNSSYYSRDQSSWGWQNDRWGGNNMMSRGGAGAGSGGGYGRGDAWNMPSADTSTWSSNSWGQQRSSYY